MHTHFASETVSTDNSPSADALDKDMTMSLQARIDNFKCNDLRMEELNEFLNKLIENAEIEANKLHEHNQQKLSQQTGQAKDKSRQSHHIATDLKNGKMINRARGLVSRLFDAICNCANVVAPASRIKLHGAASLNPSNASEPMMNQTNGSATDTDPDTKDKKSPPETAKGMKRKVN